MHAAGELQRELVPEVREVDLVEQPIDLAGALSSVHYEQGESVYRFDDDALNVYVLVNGGVRFSLGGRVRSSPMNATRSSTVL